MNAKKEQAGKPGFILLHRSLMEKGYYTDSHFVHLWVHILMKASHTTCEFLHGNTLIKLEPGQFIAGRDKLAAETGLNPYKIERVLKVLETEQQIAQQTFSKYRIITVLRWNEYQNCTTKRTTTAQQPHTFNTLKEDILSIEERKLKFASTLEPFLEKYGRDMLNKFYRYWVEPNKSGTKFKQEQEKTWDLGRRLETWSENDKVFNKQPKYSQLPNAIL